MSEPHSTTGPPSSVRRYEPLFEVASGSTGTVWVARARGGGARLVALKHVRRADLADVDALARLHDAVQATRGVEHPGLAVPLDLVVGDSEIVIASRWVDAASLRSLLAAAPVAPAVAVRFACGLLDALAAAHDAGWVHGDLSPANVLLDEQGGVTLVDLALPRGELLTAGAAVALGKLGYRAPEQLVRGEEVGRAADVFVAATLLVELLTGARAIDASSPEAERDALARPPHLPVGVPRALEQPLLRALTRDADARFADARSLRDALVAALPPASESDLGAWVIHHAGDELGARRTRVGPTDASEPMPRSVPRPRGAAFGAHLSEPPPEVEADQVLSSVTIPPSAVQASSQDDDVGFAIDLGSADDESDDDLGETAPLPRVVPVAEVAAFALREPAPPVAASVAVADDEGVEGARDREVHGADDGEPDADAAEHDAGDQDEDDAEQDEDDQPSVSVPPDDDEVDPEAARVPRIDVGRTRRVVALVVLVAAALAAVALSARFFSPGSASDAARAAGAVAEPTPRPTEHPVVQAPPAAPAVPLPSAAEPVAPAAPTEPAAPAPTVAPAPSVIATQAAPSPRVAVPGPVAATQPIAPPAGVVAPAPRAPATGAPWGAPVVRPAPTTPPPPAKRPGKGYASDTI